MTGEPNEPRGGADDTILQQQYLRALSSFEGIVLSQIDVKNKLGDRLNYSIRAGLIILSVIAFSILVLLLTLTSQINRISGVVGAMNTHFSAVSARMGEISGQLASMEQQVAHLQVMEAYTGSMRAEMDEIGALTTAMDERMQSMARQMEGTRVNIENIAGTMGAMNHEIQAMSVEMHRMSKPARTLNNIFPFP